MTLISRLERDYTPDRTMKPKKPPLYKLCLWAIAEWIESKIPAGWKYRLLRRWLTYEMIAAGWTSDKEGNLLTDDSAIDGGTGMPFRIRMADHDAIQKHFRQFPLRDKP